MPVRVEARSIETRTKLQYATALGVLLCRLTLGYEPAHGGIDQGGTGRGKERSAAQCSALSVFVHHWCS
jgi:hypothetical protein